MGTCDQIAASLALPSDFVRRSSRVFTFEGVEYTLAEVVYRFPPRAGYEYACVLWDGRSGDLLSYGGWYMPDWDALYGCDGGSGDCDMPGYASPLVGSLEFAEFADFISGSKPLALCRRDMEYAQIIGMLPTPTEIAGD
jgi:hypothetical protein